MKSGAGCWEAEGSRLSVIVPAREEQEAAGLLQDLQRVSPASWKTEIFFAKGNQPAVQRNAALREASGQWVLFLDADCQVDVVYFETLGRWMDEAVDVVGGPVLLPEGERGWGRIFQEVLGGVLAGAVGNRYRSRGHPRSCTDRELILCNLLVRREWFEKVGNLNEDLYPNEENEWLDRLKGSAKLIHDPGMVVRRPQRKNPAEFTRMLARYGAGRSRQALVSGKWEWMNSLAAVPVLGVGLLLLWPGVFLLSGGLGLVFLAGCGWGARQLFPSFRCRVSGGESLLVGVFSGWMMLTYSLGQFLGLLGWPKRERVLEPEVFRIQ